MRILLLTHYFEPESGAPQRRWDAMIREFVAAGHDVTVYCPPPHYPSGRLDRRHRRLKPGSVQVGEHGATVHRVAWLPHFGDIGTRTLDHIVASMDTARRAARHIKRSAHAPDVIVATAPAIPTLIAARALSKRFGIPVVTEMRDAWPDLVTHMPIPLRGGGVLNRIKGAIHERITSLQRSSAAVVVTTATFAAVLQARGLTDVHVIRNGAHPERFATLPPRNQTGGKLRALYMGNLGRSQGLDVVIRAAHRLHQLGVQIEVRLVGAGFARASLGRLNEELGRPVELHESVEPHEVAAHYAWADTTIVSLRDWEPFTWTIPSKLYELLSSGRHITGILAGESASILEATGCGDVVPPGDTEALVRLWQSLESKPERLEIGDAGRAWVSSHVAFPRLAEQYLDVMSRTLQRLPQCCAHDMVPDECER